MKGKPQYRDKHKALNISFLNKPLWMASKQPKKLKNTTETIAKNRTRNHRMMNSARTGTSAS